MVRSGNFTAAFVAALFLVVGRNLCDAQQTGVQTGIIRHRHLQEDLGEEDTNDASGNFFLGIFGTSKFCTKRSDNNYQTVRIWSPFSFFYRLFRRPDFEGVCGELCKDTVCRHQPCFDDYDAPDNELCICKPNSQTFCGDNTICIENMNDQADLGTCDCFIGFDGDAESGADCVDKNGACAWYSV